MLQLDQLGAATPNVSTMDIDFGRPFMPNVNIRVSSGWEDGRGHPGLDIPVPEGTPILAIQSGTVITADNDPEGDAGKWIGIQHERGWVSRYLHLSKLLVKKGDFVGKGLPIGLSGDTGLSSTPHLHLDLKLEEQWLSLIDREVGRVRTGYFSKRDGRYGVPGEPWVPVDSYRDDVIAAAKRNRIPLYHERKRAQQEDAARAGTGVGSWGLAALGIGGLAAGVGAFFWLSSSGPAAPRGRRRWGI